MDINEIFPTFESLFDKRQFKIFKEECQRNNETVKRVQNKFYEEMKIVLSSLMNLTPGKTVRFNWHFTEETEPLFVAYLNGFILNLNSLEMYQTQYTHNKGKRKFILEIKIRE